LNSKLICFVGDDREHGDLVWQSELLDKPVFSNRSGKIEVLPITLFCQTNGGRLELGFTTNEPEFRTVTAQLPRICEGDIFACWRALHLLSHLYTTDTRPFTATIDDHCLKCAAVVCRRGQLNGQRQHTDWITRDFRSSGGDPRILKRIFPDEAEIISATVIVSERKVPISRAALRAELRAETVTKDLYALLDPLVTTIPPFSPAETEDDPSDEIDPVAYAAAQADLLLAGR